jgi:L-ascorbate metabolism protein UlaG (beta-lactamase superfamily)
VIRPALQDDAFLADVRAAAGEHDRLHAWWLGQSGFLVQWNKRHLLFDPYLSDSLTRKYAATDKPHVRMTERVIAPERLDFIDVATSSHNHTDHLDAETLHPLFAGNAGIRLVLAEANRGFGRERLGVRADDPRLIGVVDGGRAEWAGFRFTGVPAAHEDLAVDEQGRHRYMGFLVQAGPFTLYHSGDTVLYPELPARLARAKIDVAFLPINGREPARRVSGNLDGREAAELSRAAGVRWAIPCHYEMFAFNTASPEIFRAECQRLGQRCAVLRAGERWTLPRE